jgi:hypothetical protein
MRNTSQPQVPQKNNTISGLLIAAIIGVFTLCFSLLSYIAYQHGDGTAYSTGHEMGGLLANIFSSGAFKNGIGLGSIIAVLASWERNKSILWAIVHSVFGWLYVMYFVLTRNSK